MLLRTAIKDKPAKFLFALGWGCLAVTILITTLGTRWIASPPFLLGFMYGVAGVMAGLSIVFNIQALKRYRTERSGRQTRSGPRP